jgi:uncharacterized protein
MDWAWDDRKAALNKIKHGVSFEAAALALADPDNLFDRDDHADGDRWRTLGEVAGRILFVVHTWPEGQNGRIISAREATPRERRDYYERR